jgi:hypothetical protein
VWVASNTGSSSIDGSAWPSDRAWVATPGGALALVYGVSQRWALTAEVRASRMLPGPGGSSSALVSGTLGLRIPLSFFEHWRAQAGTTPAMARSTTERPRAPAMESAGAGPEA